MAADRHKHKPLRVRPTGDDREWLEDFTRAKDLPVSRVINRGLGMVRAWVEEHGWDSPAPHEHDN